MATKAELQEKLREAKAEIHRLKAELKAMSKLVPESSSKTAKATKKSAFAKFKQDYPEICSELFHLLREWKISTRNMNNTVNEIRKLIEPDEVGITETTPEGITNYLKILRKIGIEGYKHLDKNPETMERYYKIYDSIQLFKHYKVITDKIWTKYYPNERQIVSQGLKISTAYLKDRTLGTKTVVCSWDDLKNQVKGEPHKNDSIDLDRFSGEDLIREVYRRRTQRFGYLDIKAVQEKIDYEYNQKFRKDIKQDKIISLAQTQVKEETVLSNTDILDEDDISLSDFEEVK